MLSFYLQVMLIEKLQEKLKLLDQEMKEKERLVKRSDFPQYLGFSTVILFTSDCFWVLGKKD